MADSGSKLSSGVVVRALSIDRYAYDLLKEMAPTSKSYGNFIAALILAEHARRQERKTQREVSQSLMSKEGCSRRRCDVVPP